MNGLFLKHRSLIQHESMEQQAVVFYFRLRWPDVPIVCSTRGKHLSGNTKRKRMRQGARIKREGYEKGTADILFCSAKRGFHGLFIEMKKTGEGWSSVSADQIEFMRRARRQSYLAMVAIGRRSAEKILDWYML